MNDQQASLRGGEILDAPHADLSHDPVRPDGHLRPEWLAGGWATERTRVAAWAGVALVAAEWMIALSVLLAGVMLVRSGGTHPMLLIGGTAIFALFHGYSHALEASGEAAAYVAGFVVWTKAGHIWQKNHTRIFTS